MIDAFKLSPDASVADVGAGTGYFSVRHARPFRAERFTPSTSSRRCSSIRKRAAGAGLNNVVTVQASGTTPNLPKPVDVVLIVDTYHHIPTRATYFRDLKKSLTARPRRDHRLSQGLARGPAPEFRFEADEIINEMRTRWLYARGPARIPAAAALSRGYARIVTCNTGFVVTSRIPS